MKFLFGHPVRLQPYFGHRSRTHLSVSARALRGVSPKFEPKGRIQAIATMLRQFASREQPELAVTLELKSPGGDTVKREGVTDQEGFVRFEIELPEEWDLPDHTSWETVVFHWISRDGPQRVEGHVLVPGSAQELGVISDIDDTIIETGITGGLRSVARNWDRVFAQLPEERTIVPGADEFYGSLGGGLVKAYPEDGAGARVQATHRPFFYVSSSPWNLYSYLVAYKRTRKLPLGPILLRDWGLDRANFGKSSHGAHKKGAIDTLLALYPEMKFALIGDDTQGDLPAYAGVVTDNPGRIAAVFIRTAGEAMTPEEEAGKAAIEQAGVRLWLGNSYETGQDFLESAGLSHDAEAGQIVETVEDAGKRKNGK